MSCKSCSHRSVDQRLGDIAFVADHFAGKPFGHVGNGLTIVNVAGDESDGEQVAPIIRQNKPAKLFISASILVLTDLPANKSHEGCEAFCAF
jgi:hypothetical protein